MSEIKWNRKMSPPVVWWCRPMKINRAPSLIPVFFFSLSLALLWDISRWCVRNKVVVHVVAYEIMDCAPSLRQIKPKKVTSLSRHMPLCVNEWPEWSPATWARSCFRHWEDSFTRKKKQKQGGSDFLLLHLQLTLSAAAEAHNKAPSGAR